MSTKNKINQIEPVISAEDSKAVYKYLNSGGWGTEHQVTKNFESNVSNYVNRKFAVSVPNGTIAIYLALLAIGIKKGDKVAVPNLTMIATINAVIWAGAKPYLVDVDNDFTMSIEKLKKVKNLKAVIFVPLNGRSANGLHIEKWCKDNNIKLIEDSAHALGSAYENGKKCGKLGDLSIFSFTPHKIITMGQGGMILTDDRKYLKKIIDIKTFNRSKDKLDWHKGFGLNFKITDIQATLGISQFNNLSKRIENKKKIHSYYNSLSSKKFKVGQFRSFETPWFIDLICDSKKSLNLLQNKLTQLKIETRISYPALSKQKYLRDVQKGNLETSEKIFDKILWLPSSVNLKRQQIEKIVNLISDI